MYKGGKVVGRNLGAIVQKNKLVEWITSASAVSDAPGEAKAEDFKLANGLHVVVIPSPNATSISLRTLYKAGLADGFAGTFMVRVLMAGSPDKAQPVPSQNGMDVTSFMQSVAKAELQTAFENDAARMAPLSVTQEGLLEARQKATEALGRSGPAYRSQMSAALYGSHPYAMQTGGEAEKIAKVSPEDLVALHKRYFAPNNAVVIVAGPVTVEEVKRLAEATYGQVPASAEVAAQTRPAFASIEAGQRLTTMDPQAKKGVFSRRYVAPSQASGAEGEAEALEVLGQIFTAPGRLVRPAVDGGRADLIARAGYSGGNLAGGEFGFMAMADDLTPIEAEVDRVIDDIRTNGVTDAELTRVKENLAADHASANFDAKAVAARYDAIALGVSLSRIEGRAAIIAKLTSDDIRAVAEKYLDPRRAVNAVVLPDPAAAEANATLAKAG
jgi:zinc protease